VSENGVRPRLVIIVFILACASVVMSSALILSLFLKAPAPAVTSPSLDRLPLVEKAMDDRDWPKAWSLLTDAARDPGFSFGPRGIALAWELWQADTDGAALVEMARARHAARPAFDERVLLAYLLLQTGQGRVAGELNAPGAFADKFPVLEAELARERSPGAAVPFAAVTAVDLSRDNRVAIDRALALGYLGEYGLATAEADRIVRNTDAPGSGGTGMIDVSRGLCRRQIARVIQIMSLWDSEARDGAPGIKAAALELMVDPDGLVQVAPDYFDILSDALAWTGQRDELFRVYRVADGRGHGLTAAQQETRSVLSHDPSLRPASYRDIRAIVARGPAGDSRSIGPDLQEAAWGHNDERSLRIIAWYLWNTGDRKGLAALLDKGRVSRGAWYELYDGLLDEAVGGADSATESVNAATRGGMAAVATINAARLKARDGQLGLAGSLADEAIGIIAVRSLGEHLRPGSAYCAIYLDALAFRARIFTLQGREADAQNLRRQIRVLDPQHPALYDAADLPVEAAEGSEHSRDTTED
jgi:hypothetical protein